MFKFGDGDVVRIIQRTAISESTNIVGTVGVVKNLHIVKDYTGGKPHPFYTLTLYDGRKYYCHECRIEKVQTPRRN